MPTLAVSEKLKKQFDKHRLVYAGTLERNVSADEFVGVLIERWKDEI